MGEASEGSPRFQTLDLALLVALGGLWGSAYVFIREGILFGATPLLFAAVRYLLSAACFAALAAVTREAWPDARSWRISAAVGGTLLIGLYGGFLYYGEQYTTGGYASVLAATAPILTVVFAYALLPAERLGPVSLMGIALGFTGVVLLVFPELSGGSVGTWPGPLYIVAAFLCTVVGSVYLRRLGGGRQGLWQIGTQFLVGGVLLGAATLVLPIPEAEPWTPGVVGALVALVILSSVAGYFVYFTLHHRVGPVRANVVAYLLPLVGIGLGSGFFGEPVTTWEIAGFLVVIAGVTLVLWESSRRH